MNDRQRLTPVMPAAPRRATHRRPHAAATVVAAIVTALIASLTLPFPTLAATAAAGKAGAAAQSDPPAPAPAGGAAEPALPSPPSSPPAAADGSGTLSLRRATALALGNDPEVAAAAAAAAADDAAARVVADAFRTEAGVSSTPGIGRGLPVAVAGQVPAVASVAVHQLLYNNEQRAKGFSARATTAVTQATWQRTRVTTARTVAALYARAWSDQLLVAAADRRLAACEAMSRRAADLHAEGRSTDLDLAQARLREAKARLRRLEVVSARDADQWELRRRLGLGAGAPLDLPADPLADLPDPAASASSANLADLAIVTPSAGAAPAAGPENPPAPPDPNLTAALAADVTLHGLDHQIELLTRAREQRDGWLSPLTVDAEAQYSRLSRANGVDQFYVKFREDDWSVALALSYPLWTGGRLRDGIARNDANIEQLKQQRSARVEQLAIDVHRAEATLDQARAGLDIARQASAVAEEDLRISGALAAEGRAQPDAQDSREATLADAREEDIKAAAALLDARVGLLAVRGDLLAILGIGLADSGNPP
jgi:outer membrane protein TolC